MIDKQRGPRSVMLSTALAGGTFAIAWMMGRAGIRLSVPHALVIAVHSYVFWGYSFVGLMATDFFLYLTGSGIDYVPPPVGVLALRPASLRSVAIVSVVHGLLSGATSALLWHGLLRVTRQKVRRGLLIGACVGILIGIAAVLPRDVLLTSTTLDVALTYATAPVDILFGWFHVTVPIATHRVEMSLQRMPRLVGAYVLLLSVAYALIAGAVARLLSMRGQKKLG